MKLSAAIAAGFALCACNPAGSSNSVAEPMRTDHAAGTKQNSSPQPDIERGTQMLPIEILITSDRGEVSAELADNDAARALAKMLPLDIAMRDHLRQEKTGTLPAPLPGGNRQTNFSVGTLGLWGDRDFVIYYREGRVPAPGIVVLGQVRGDVSFFDNPGSVSISLKRAE